MYVSQWRQEQGDYRTRSVCTYLVIPASNIDSRAEELDSIRTWASTNNLKLNLKKSVEIVFVDSTRRRLVQLPNP